MKLEESEVCGCGRVQVCGRHRKLGGKGHAENVVAAVRGLLMHFDSNHVVPFNQGPICPCTDLDSTFGTLIDGEGVRQLPRCHRHSVSVHFGSVQEIHGPVVEQVGGD